MLSILIVHRFELFPLIWSSSASQISPQSLFSQLNFSERMPSTRIRKFWTNTSSYALVTHLYLLFVLKRFCCFSPQWQFVNDSLTLLPTFESCLTSILWVNRWWVGGWLILTCFGVFLSQQIAKDFLFFSFFFFFCFVSFPFQTGSLLSSFSSKFIGWNIFYLSIHLYPPLSSSLSYYPPLSSSLSLIIHLFHHHLSLIIHLFHLLSLLLLFFWCRSSCLCLLQ